MALLSPELGERFEGLKQRFASASRTEDLASNKSEVRPIKDQNLEQRSAALRWVQDDPESVWGTGKGPTPTDYFITSEMIFKLVVDGQNVPL